MARGEDQLQLRVCDYIRNEYGSHILFNTDTSGLKLSMGMAIRAKKMRSHNGFPDMVIYEQKRGYSGLFMELKRAGIKVYKKDGSLRKDPHLQEQAEMHIMLRERGFCADFFIGFEECKNIIDWYLK